jgi:hypothetical protein
LSGLGNQPASECVVLEIAELGEAGLRAFGFWLFLFSPKYRAQEAHDWRDASAGRRVVLASEGLLAVVLGVGVPVAGRWWLLKP